MAKESELKSVYTFWNTEACGTHFIQSFGDDTDFFEKFREHRFRTEWHIPLLVPFAEAKGKKVLEIAVGHATQVYRINMLSPKLRKRYRTRTASS